MTTPISPVLRGASSSSVEPRTQQGVVSQATPAGVGAAPTRLVNAVGETPTNGEASVKKMLLEVNLFMSFYFFLLSEEDKKKIKNLVHFLATSDSRKLFWSQKKLRGMWYVIEHIHPLKLVIYILNDADVKKDLQTLHELYNDKCKIGVWGGWGRFLKQFGKKMEKAIAENSVKDYLPIFCRNLKVQVEEIEPIIDEGDWDKLLTKLLLREAKTIAPPMRV